MYLPLELPTVKNFLCSVSLLTLSNSDYSAQLSHLSEGSSSYILWKPLGQLLRHIDTQM